MAVPAEVCVSLDDLADVLDRLGVGIDACDNPSLVPSLGRLAGLRSRLEAVWLTAVGRAFDRGLRPVGYRDTATWIASLTGERRGTARRDVELAVQLAEIPAVADAMATGEVSKAKAAELVHTTDLPTEVQEALVGQAGSLSVEQVANAVRQARLDHGAESTAVTPTLTISRRSARAVLEATVDLVDAETLEVALSTAVEAMDLPKTMPYTERRARALSAIAQFFLDHQTNVTGRVGRPHVLVLVDLEVLEARSGGSAVLESGAVITGDQARQLAQDANLCRIITRGRSEPLDVGRSTRTIPPAIAKAVITRDRHCKFESCTAPVWACHIHHRQPWEIGGVTALSNTGLLCWYHHQHVHRVGPHHLRTDPDGRWTLASAEKEGAA
ncbi:MAG TPA: DUF222 domain-containing protein [Acidimicrobiales bacterium]